MSEAACLQVRTFLCRSYLSVTFGADLSQFLRYSILRQPQKGPVKKRDFVFSQALSSPSLPDGFTDLPFFR